MERRANELVDSIVVAVPFGPAAAGNRGVCKPDD